MVMTTPHAVKHCRVKINSNFVEYLKSEVIVSKLISIEYENYFDWFFLKIHPTDGPMVDPLLFHHAEPNNAGGAEEIKTHFSYWANRGNWEINDEPGTNSYYYICEYGEKLL